MTTHVDIKLRAPGAVCFCAQCEANYRATLEALATPHAVWYGVCESCGTGPAGENGLCGPCSIASAMPWR